MATFRLLSHSVLPKTVVESASPVKPESCGSVMTSEGSPCVTLMQWRILSHWLPV